MKPKFLFICLLLSTIGFSAFAQQSVPQDKKIQLTETATSLVVEDDITVVLTDSKADYLSVEGDSKAVVATIQDGQLVLSARKSHLASNVTVFVPAGQLSKVFLNGTGSLSSSDILSNQKIKIYLASEAKINVRSKGAVSVEAFNDIQFVRGK
jgi:formylmethanofuran dehydrogenase subunit D